MLLRRTRWALRTLVLVLEGLTHGPHPQKRQAQIQALQQEIVELQHKLGYSTGSIVS